MKRIYIDFETYWAADYSVGKMVTIDYILDPRFETMGCGVAIDSDKPFWLPRDKVRDYLETLVREPYMCISHNALFDASILAYRYQIHPTLIIDTMGMARAILMAELPQGRVSLKKIAQFLDIGTKGETNLKTKGLTRKELESKPFLYREFAKYCLNDTDLCRKIYLKLKNRFPATEHIIMDMIIKTTTQPQLQLNEEHLQEHLKEVIATKAETLAAVSQWFTVDDLMSNPKFAQALKFFGVQPPTKISPSTGKLTWAFAKADVQFMELLEHPDPDVQALMAARLGHKSTLEETRTERFISIVHSTKNYWNDTYIPMALRYAGAHTHRFSGDWGLNLQNLPSRKSKKLRQSIIAPPGHVILAADAAQIEARLVAWFARQRGLLNAFEQGRDVYKEFACDLFHIELEDVTKIQRFIAKECILGLGFQLGKVKLLNTLITKAKDQNIPIEIPFTIEQTGIWVDTYRNRMNNIRQYWGHLRDCLPVISGIPTDYKIGQCCIIEHQKIRLPNGLYLYYNDLHLNDKNEWWFTYGGRQKKLYGGKLLENLVQAFDRMIVMDAALRIFQRTGYRIAHQMHDEILYIVSEGEADALKQVVLEEMERRPTYAPDLPLKAEAKIAHNYGDL
jgi:DNA polymerase I-like protein with 3'-5' exonuclease and polymerase domains